MTVGDQAGAGVPAWAEWAETASYTVGAEEEVMVLDPGRDWALAPRLEQVMPILSPTMTRQTTRETQDAVLELATRPHPSAEATAAEATMLRARLTAELAPLGLRAASAGTHPCAVWNDTRISSGDRHQEVYGSMRELARREPTFGLHVHVGVADAESAILLHNRLRGHLPLLLALSANSPFWQGRDSGPGLGPHADLPGLSARRDAARLLRLRRVRGHRGPAAALPGVSRSDLPVVGHPSSAALRHRRDPHHGRPERVLGDSRADHARAVDRSPRARGGLRRQPAGGLS